MILPSSFYKCDDVVNSFDERFTIYCRDQQSFDYCTSLNKRAKFILHNDMAFSADFSCFQLNDLNDVVVADAK